MTSQVGFIDELERDLGLTARLRVMTNAGGQRRYVPMPDSVEGSVLAAELGEDVCCWLAGRWGGETVVFPSRRGSEREDNAALLRAAVLDAGLTEPSRSANDIAMQFRVTVRWVKEVRSQLRKEQCTDQLPLFDRL